MKVADLRRRIELGEIDSENLILELLLWSVLDQPLSESYKKLNATIGSRPTRGQKVIDSSYNVLSWLKILASLEPNYLGEAPGKRKTHWNVTYESMFENLAADIAKIESFQNNSEPLRIIHDAYQGPPTRIYRSFAVKRLADLFEAQLPKVDRWNQIGELYGQFGISINASELYDKFSSEMDDLPNPIDLWKDLERLNLVCSLAPAISSK